jgi:aspartyl aminopeptidase
LFQFQALIDATSSESSLVDETGVRMVALFDHEEIGSNSAQGAGSPVMLNALSRITSSFGSDSKVITAPRPSNDYGFILKK